jgi:hypothetical protein
MFTVDGMTWDIPCDITRTAQITASEISGLLLNKEYFNDVIGTYMQYEVTLIPSPSNLSDYYSLYQIITQPVSGHTWVFPYNGTTITITGRVEEISDVYVRLPNGGRMWKGVSFTVTANNPSRT